MLQLFHTGFQVIRKPDIRAGRKNADFGQGFYLADDQEFSRRWAQERKGSATYLNAYELDTEGLAVKHFSRDAEWFKYIKDNRSDRPDTFADYDVIIGPIANDTIFETWGIITSGLLEEDQALRLLMIGRVYEQTVIKTEKAAALLRFKEASEVSGEEIAMYQELVRREELEFQEEAAKLLEDMGIVGE